MNYRTDILMLPVSRTPAADSAGTVRIAAASSLQFALNEVIDTYRASWQAGKATPKIQLVYGSSGNLYRQIVQGAPFDLFLSADASLVDKLHQQGVAPNSGVEFGRGRLVVATGKHVAVRDSSAAAVLNALAVSVEDSRLAIANPAHAPYGKAAKQLFESLNLWTQLKPKLVYGEKVSQAAQFVTSGAVETAVISLSLALAIEVDYLPVDAKYHQPIAHKMLLLTDDEESITHLYHYLTDDVTVAAVFARYGYTRVR